VNEFNFAGTSQSENLLQFWKEKEQTRNQERLQQEQEIQQKNEIIDQLTEELRTLKEQNIRTGLVKKINEGELKDIESRHKQEQAGLNHCRALRRTAKKEREDVEQQVLVLEKNINECRCSLEKIFKCKRRYQTPP